ncbi:hypothetical protein [Geothrix mesophila]|uniref:hypothetical protein n=1 Tax=Geothrix mesophila TaxID=2922723 RepID=UPI001FAD84A0|nr:hypothetical protein [Geothrix sp. SG198]
MESKALIYMLSEAQDPTSGPFWYVSALIVGGVLGWILNALRTKSEINKLNTEIGKLKIESTKMAAELLDKIYEAEDKYRIACEKMDKETLALVKKIKTDASSEEINIYHENFCKILLNEVTNSLIRRIDYAALRHTNNPNAAYTFVRDHVCVELIRLKKWVDTANLKIFTEKLGKSPVKLSPYSFDCLDSLLDLVGPEDKSSARDLLSAARSQLFPGV